jgi:hypothetical protein
VREPEATRSAPSRAQELLQRLEQQRRPEPEPKPRPTPKADAKLEQLVAEVRALGRADRERLRIVEPPAFEWKRPALAVGGLVVGVGVLGAAAGLSVAGHEQAVHGGAAVSVPLPQATPAAALDAQPSDLVGVDHAQPVAARRRDPAARRSKVEQVKPEVEPIGEMAASSSPATATAAEAPALAAAMPLPAAVVSRTIERIGYPCGGVASSAPAEGSAGVFTVTCASGHSYRAAPVHGRYRFRRVAG